MNHMNTQKILPKILKKLPFQTMEKGMYKINMKF